MKLREDLNPEEKLDALGYPTPYLTANNPHALHCQACAHLYYVDDSTYRKALSGLEGDCSEIRFICKSCENEYGEEGRGH